jgi:hypothetical protein
MTASHDEKDSGKQLTSAGCVVTALCTAVMFCAAVPIVRWRDPDTGRPLPRVVAIGAPFLLGAACYGLGVALLALLGKSVWANPKKPSPGHPGPGGAESPRAVFDRAATAVAREDWHTLFHCIDPTQTDLMLAAASAFAAFAASASPEAEARWLAVLDRHGAAPAPHGHERPGHLSECITDRAALFADLTEFLKSDLGGPTWPPLCPRGELQNMRIDGPRADGFFTDADGARESVHFVQVGERWYLALPTERG